MDVWTLVFSPDSQARHCTHSHVLYMYIVHIMCMLYHTQSCNVHVYSTHHVIVIELSCQFAFLFPQFLATGSHNGKINLFSVEEGEKASALDTRGKFIMSIAYVSHVMVM